VWWYPTVIPATWEAEIGGLWFKVSLSKKKKKKKRKVRPYLKNTLSKSGLA
jgi:hypothetical protein